MSTDNTSLDNKVKLDGETVTLADLAGLNFDEFAEVRGDSFPKGTFIWEIVGGDDTPKLKVLGEGDKAKGAISYACKCLDVIGISDQEFTGKPDELIGKTHYETFFLQDVAAIGRVKAWNKDVGAPYVSNFNAGCAATVGARFQGTIIKRKNKDNTDIIYTNIDKQSGKIKPLARAAAPAMAASA